MSHQKPTLNFFYFTKKNSFFLEKCASFFGYLATTHTKEHLAILALLGSSFLARKAWTDPQIAAEAGI